MLYDAIFERSSRKKKEYITLLKQLKKKRPSDLDYKVREFHENAFSTIDCLKCANCCKSISPALYDKDIDRLAKELRLKPSVVAEEYLVHDEEQDWVFRQTPCPFLGDDHFCSVYDSRPLACREYPHTNRIRFYQLLDLSLKNASVCPAVCVVLDDLMRFYKK